MAMGSTAARVGTVILPFTLQLQLSVPWLTQVRSNATPCIEWFDINSASMRVEMDKYNHRRLRT